MEMGLFAPLPRGQCQYNGLFSLAIVDLLSTAEAASMLLTANQSGTYRYTTIDTASAIRTILFLRRRG